MQPQAAPDSPCGFADGLPKSAPDGTDAVAPTEEAITRTLVATPRQLRNDVRVMLVTTRLIVIKSRDIKNLPAEERAGRADELIKLLSDSGYIDAAQRVDDYLSEHCPGEVAKLHSGMST